jgi:hypothetical protein
MVHWYGRHPGIVEDSMELGVCQAFFLGNRRKLSGVSCQLGGVPGGRIVFEAIESAGLKLRRPRSTPIGPITDVPDAWDRSGRNFRPVRRAQGKLWIGG